MSHQTLLSANIRTAVSAAIRLYGVAPSRFGRDALRDPAFVIDLLRRDRHPRPATEAKVRAYIASLNDREERHDDR